MFEVGWCVAMYLSVLFLEFCPALCEWLGLTKARKRLKELTLALTAFGVVLSTLHQSSLGALFLLAPDKVHPLWYSPFLPVMFFVSSIAAGLSMVIVEGALAHRAFRDQIDPQHHVDLEAITLGLGRGAAVVLFAYFFIKLQALAAGEHWALLGTGWGAWYLVELAGFVALPCAVFAVSARHGSVRGVRTAAGIAVVGIVLNRLNVSVVAFQWNVVPRYIPSAAEILVSITIVTLGVLTYRWIVNRMPILHEHPDYRH
jgi:Ni/Fe-hydrogenase subunit HybB-like protein